MEILVLALGLSVGSFLSAFTFRSVKGKSILAGRSFCPHCKTKINWYDNIPLFSYFFLKGKCRSCGKRISPRYPLIEAGTALLFLGFFASLSGCSNILTSNSLCFWRSEFGMAVYLFIPFLISLLVAIFVIDLENKIIPDGLVFWGILFVFAFYFLSDSELILRNFLTGLIASLFFLFIHLVTSGRGMGLGDVKFVLLGGFILGWPLTGAWLFLAFALGAVIGVILILLKKARFGKEIPFGPYLVASLLFTMVFGQKVLNLYL